LLRNGVDYNAFPMPNGSAGAWEMNPTLYNVARTSRGIIGNFVNAVLYDGIGDTEATSVTSIGDANKRTTLSIPFKRALTNGGLATAVNITTPNGPDYSPHKKKTQEKKITPECMCTSRQSGHIFNS
jgi:hypothetical protein